MSKLLKFLLLNTIQPLTLRKKNFSYKKNIFLASSEIAESLKNCNTSKSKILVDLEVCLVRKEKGKFIKMYK